MSGLKQLMSACTYCQYCVTIDNSEVGLDHAHAHVLYAYVRIPSVNHIVYCVPAGM